VWAGGYSAGTKKLSHGGHGGHGGSGKSGWKLLRRMEVRLRADRVWAGGYSGEVLEAGRFSQGSTSKPQMLGQSVEQSAQIRFFPSPPCPPCDSFFPVSRSSPPAVWEKDGLELGGGLCYRHCRGG
jgi:hypothetical protein